ncbi:Gti1/Pac2 family-domain-containing protein [Podospora aff. communis PSN243]|uniref:Gti1/Pac2 family-domain-containing protein n=1 Tax=Podospora aff. communis PSN243 TaxID=3040156 RepID=A0AAV9H7M2_9PEZI|nr:Gti1/Pac2 family-domain-containing protein [Podospora aff. communis PSN243]
MSSLPPTQQQLPGVMQQQGAAPRQKAMQTQEPIVPTYQGMLLTTSDALVLVEACLQGRLPHISRRPQDKERPDLIRSGNVFIYQEEISGIKRWTDGCSWSPSRILGNYLVYRELSKPAMPGEGRKALKNPKKKAGDSGITKRGASNTPSPPSFNVGPLVEAEGNDADLLRPFVGSLTDTYDFKRGGLVKRTIPICYNNAFHHIVSYYSLEDALGNKLKTPTQDHFLRDIMPREDLLDKQKQRFNFTIDQNIDPHAANFNVNPNGNDVWGPNQQYLASLQEAPLLHYPEQSYHHPIAGYEEEFNDYRPSVNGYHEALNVYQPPVNGFQEVHNGYQQPVDGLPPPVNEYQPPMNDYPMADYTSFGTAHPAYNAGSGGFPSNWRDEIRPAE